MPLNPSRLIVWLTRGAILLTLVRSQLLNEIMPMIYKRFTEKSAEEWRQIYKVDPVELRANDL